MIFYRVIVLTVVVLITITNVSSLKLPKLLQKISIRNHMSSQDSSVNKNPFLSIRKKLIVTPLLGLVSLLPTKIVHAASAVKVNGWDIYGRVPYDDWLFTNWKLTNPDLYKRSLAEVVSISSYWYCYLLTIPPFC